MRPRVMTIWLDSWYGSGRGKSSESMLFGNGLMDQLGFDEVHIPMEELASDFKAASMLIKQKLPVDWAFIVPFQEVHYELSDLFKGIPLVAWMCDDVWRYSNFGRYWAQVADFMATTSAEVLPKYGDKGILVNWACRPEWAEYDKQYKVDRVGFAGQPYGQRGAKAKELADAGVPLVTNNTATDYLPAEEYFKFMGESTFSLCLSASSHGPAQMKSRMFEPQVMGSILLTEPTPGLEYFWIPGEECVVYNSPSECKDAVRFLLDHPLQLHEIREAARKRALAEHTYHNRFAAILSRIGAKV